MSLFKAGDKVGSMWGDGVVSRISGDGYSVCVEVGNILWFTMEGKNFSSDEHPSIWHKETGSAPIVGERPFEYPIHKECMITGEVVEFTALDVYEVLIEGHAKCSMGVGYISKGTLKHTRCYWKDCKKPTEHKEMTIAEIEAALGYGVKVVKEAS